MYQILDPQKFSKTLKEGFRTILRRTYVRAGRSVPPYDVYRHFPFLQYALNWNSHAEVVEEHGIPQADLLTFFGWPSEGFIWSRRIAYRPQGTFDYSTTQRQSLLHTASQNGLFSVVEAMIGSDVRFDINQVNGEGETPLSVATRSNQEAIVSLFAGRGDGDINSIDRIGNRHYHTQPPRDIAL